MGCGTSKVPVMGPSTPTRVLFVCSHNSNRSIAAEAVARKERPDLFVTSAGVDAAGIINTKMTEALVARGYSTDGLRSKKTEDPEVGGLNNNWDYIIMMGCLAGLPSEPPAGTVVENWGLPDPAAEPKLLDSVIDAIITKVNNLGRPTTAETKPVEDENSELAAFIQNFTAWNKVAMFSKTYCPYSKRAKDIFQQIGAAPAVVELDIREDGPQLQAALGKVTGRTTVPQVFINNKFIGGSDEVAALRESGELVKLVNLY